MSSLSVCQGIRAIWHKLWLGGGENTPPPPALHRLLPSLVRALPAASAPSRASSPTGASRGWLGLRSMPNQEVEKPAAEEAAEATGTGARSWPDCGARSAEPSRRPRLASVSPLPMAAPGEPLPEGKSHLWGEGRVSARGGRARVAGERAGGGASLWRGEGSSRRVGLGRAVERRGPGLAGGADGRADPLGGH